MCLTVRATGRVSGPTPLLMRLLVQICGNLETHQQGHPSVAGYVYSQLDLTGHPCLRSNRVQLHQPSGAHPLSLSRVVGKELTQGTQHGPPSVNQLDLTVPLERLWVS